MPSGMHAHNSYTIIESTTPIRLAERVRTFIDTHGFVPIGGVCVKQGRTAGLVDGFYQAMVSGETWAKMQLLAESAE